MQYIGRPGLLMVTAAAVPIGLFTAWHMRPLAVPDATAGGAPPAAASPEPTPAARIQMGLFALVIVLAGLRTSAQVLTTTFAPKFFQDQGVEPGVYGA